MAKKPKYTEVYIEASDLGCEYGTITASEKSSRLKAVKLWQYLNLTGWCVFRQTL